MVSQNAEERDLRQNIPSYEGEGYARVRESWVKPASSALLVIDVQNDYCHEEGALSLAKDVFPFYTTKFIQEMVPTLHRLVTIARKTGLKVIFIRSEYGEWTNSKTWLRRGAGRELRICEPDSWGADWYRMDPDDSDLVLVKHRYSPFVSTAMETVLRANSIETVIITGTTTNVCIESTSRDAFMRDFRVVVVEDCVASYDSGLHQASLINITRHFGTVVTSQQLVELWRDAGKSVPEL